MWAKWTQGEAREKMITSFVDVPYRLCPKAFGLEIIPLIASFLFWFSNSSWGSSCPKLFTLFLGLWDNPNVSAVSWYICMLLQVLTSSVLFFTINLILLLVIYFLVCLNNFLEKCYLFVWMNLFPSFYYIWVILRYPYGYRTSNK